MKAMNKALVHAAMALAFAMTAATVPMTAHAVTSDQLPEAKRSQSGLYLEAKEVPAFIEAHGGAAKVLFVDIRTRSEAMYVGMPTTVDAFVPYVEHSELMNEWDATRNIYKLEPFQDFVPEMQRRLEAKGLAKTDLVVLICRSGDRSSRGANRLAEAGFTRVYSVVDGFEGDMSKEGRRSVNGWKNAGLPWSYKLDKQKMYFAK